jgi:hypothetical protein
LTLGYWKNHAGAWPVTQLTLGGAVYDKAELLAILEASPQGDASIILAHQLITAELNVAAGASSAHIETTIILANAWLKAHQDADGRLPFGTPAATCDGDPTSLADRLDEYNNGHLGVPHCGG